MSPFLPFVDSCGNCNRMIVSYVTSIVDSRENKNQP